MRRCGVNIARVHKTGTSPHDVLATFEPAADDSRHARPYTAIRYAVFNPHSMNCNFQRGHARPFHFSATAPQPETLRDPPAYSRGELRDADPAASTVFTAVENFPADGNSKTIWLRHSSFLQLSDAGACAHKSI